jgi:hypothetical protein
VPSRSSRRDAADQFRRADAWHERQIFDSSAIRNHRCRLGDRPAVWRGVFGPFRVNVRRQVIENRFGRFLVKYDHVIDDFQSREKFRPFAFVQHRPCRAFVLPDGSIRIQADDKHIAEGLRGREAGDMAGVEQVETTVRPDDRFAVFAIPIAKGHCLRQ